MNPLTIRQIKPTDLKTVSAIELTCFPEAEAANYKSFEKRIAVYPAGFLVGELDGEVIGFINGGATNNMTIEDEFFCDMTLHSDTGKNMVIFGLDVLPEHRKKGIAEALLNSFITTSKQLNKKSILLTCKTHLIAYYEKFGFIPFVVLCGLLIGLGRNPVGR